MDVSLIIPAYNAELFIARALSSLKMQDTKHSEVIVVDNNSTDKTVEVARDFSAQESVPIRIVREYQQGEAAARNRGILEAKGKYIQFLDADDYLLPGKVNRHLALAKYGSDFIIGASQRIFLSGKVFEVVPLQDFWQGLCSGKFGDSNSNFYTKEILQRIGGFDESIAIGTDIDLYFRLLCFAKNIIIDETVGSVYVDRAGERMSDSNVVREYARRVKKCQRIIDWLGVNKVEYFSKHQAYFYSYMLHNMRLLATTNIDESAVLEEIYFPDGISRSQIDFNILPPFAAFYPVLGFKLIERGRLAASKLLPASVKTILRGKDNTD
jgi:glycosyltransferase involved in cell wall biosynthesis